MSPKFIVGTTILLVYMGFPVVDRLHMISRSRGQQLPIAYTQQQLPADHWPGNSAAPAGGPRYLAYRQQVLAMIKGRIILLVNDWQS